MNYKFILALDPSGSYTEGKGTTGWCVFNVLDGAITVVGKIEAIKFNCTEAYWDAHLKIIDEFKKRYKDKMIVVIEDYLLYASKAEKQINSRMETPKLIGLLQHHCWKTQTPYEMQLAALVKTRWANDILIYKNFLQKKGNKYYIPGMKQSINRHCKDAVRHAVHYAAFKNKEREDMPC